MENRVYYGEYSLRHWINLILKGNLVIPDYQRYFVWSENKVEKLIETFKCKQFVPPVTIGAFKMQGGNVNLILDGQQRVTSILLAYLGLYPDTSAYRKAIEVFANDNDDPDEEHQLDNVLAWNLNKLTEKGKSKEVILSKIQPGNYKSITLPTSDRFLDETFLGFCYLVPQSQDEVEQQKYYSSVFRNINIQGEPLLPQESRASLYFLDQNLANLFAPKFFNSIVIKLISNETKADFVRYLSLLSQFKHKGTPASVARGYKQKMEKFYEEYIYSAVSDEESEIFGKFSSLFPDKNYIDILDNLQKDLEGLGLDHEYSSIIEVDTFIFGLIYQVVFNKRRIDLTRKPDLISALNSRISGFKSNSSHQKSPNNLTHLRSRISSSIDIYEGYVVNEPQ